MKTRRPGMPPLLGIRTISHRVRCTGLLVAFYGCSAAGGTTPDATDPRIAWQIDERGWGVPAVDESAAYFLTPTHRLTVVDKLTGSIRGEVSLGIAAPQPPGFAVVRAGSVVAAVDNGVLYAFSRDATPIRQWIFVPPTGALEDWITADATTIYAGSSDAYLYAIDAATGTLRWRTQVSTETAAQAMGPRLRDGVVYAGVKRIVAPTQGGVVAVDAVSGHILWTRGFVAAGAERGAGCAGQVAFSTDHAVVAAADDGQIYSLDPVTGAVRWVASSLTKIPAVYGGDPAMDQRPLVAVNQLVVAGSSTGYLVGLDAATGVERWRSRADQGSAVFPLAEGGGTVYATHFGGQLVAFDAATGTVRWIGGREHGGGTFSHAPTLDGSLLFVSGYHGLYAVRALE
jgi:eukaryotic-like serine/threonine-protein kinase